MIYRHFENYTYRYYKKAKETSVKHLCKIFISSKWQMPFFFGKESKQKKLQLSVMIYRHFESCTHRYHKKAEKL